MPRDYLQTRNSGFSHLGTWCRVRGVGPRTMLLCGVDGRVGEAARIQIMGCARPLASVPIESSCFKPHHEARYLIHVTT